MRVWLYDRLDMKRYIHFNSHTREGVTAAFILMYLLAEISTHTPVRVWRLRLVARLHSLLISTHTPVRVWQVYLNVSVIWPCISTHTPVRVWRSPCTYTAPAADFNSHTREGVTHFSEICAQMQELSTPTPVRVWPEYPNSHVHYGLISTHTPVRVWP